MLEPLKDLPGGVIGFEAVGEIRAADYERTLRSPVDAAARGGRIRFVYVLGERFDGFSAGAGLADTRVGFAHLRAWHRIALVSDIDWINHLASLSDG